MELSKKTENLFGQPMFSILQKTKKLEKQGKKIIHFELGEPDFNTPDFIKIEAINSIVKNKTHYAPSGGLHELKEAAAQVTFNSRGFMPNPSQLLVTAGANIQIFYALSCIADIGDNVIMANPSFVSYQSIASYLGIECNFVNVYEENNFNFNPDDIKKTINPKTKAIIINSPANPTGAVMTKKEIQEIYKHAEQNNLWVISDEIYARMIYDAEFYSPSMIDYCEGRTILINGFSKSYAMTGWRLGVMTGPIDLIEKCRLLLETTSSCVSPFIQLAGVKALTKTQDEIFTMMQEYKKRRDKMVELINKLPNVSCINPKGAFYCFANIKKTGMTSEQFCDFALEKPDIGIAISPGTFFGNNGEGYVRFCYANSIDNIITGIKHLGCFL